MFEEIAAIIIFASLLAMMIVHKLYSIYKNKHSNDMDRLKDFMENRQ
jgi:hypothetical protein